MFLPFFYSKNIPSSIFLCLPLSSSTFFYLPLPIYITRTRTRRFHIFLVPLRRENYLPVEIQVTYRRTSRLSMRIAKGGAVHVSAPYGTPESVVREFIGKHTDWIQRAQERTLEREQTRRDFYAQLPLQTRAQRQAAEARLDALVRPMIERYASQMGVRPQFLYYRATRSRWGLCHTGRRAICLSLFLLLMPEWCIEHTVVHEMCHLLVPNHGPRFHALMDRYFPRWREARAEMRRVSRMEE